MSEYPPVSAVAAEAQEPMTQEDQFKLVLIDQSQDARDQARDLADKQLTQELNEGGRFKRMVSSVWKGNLLKEYYHLKYTRQHETAIRESNDVLQDESLADARTKSINSLVNRFQNGDDELIHTNAGEKRSIHVDDTLSTGIKKIIRDYAVGTLNETTLNQEKKKLLEDFGRENPNVDLSKSLALTDNMLEVANAIKGRFEHDDAMEHAINNMQIITGEARNGARTEVQYSKVDKLATWLSSTKAGSLATPGAIATGVALAASISGVGFKSAAGAIAATVAPGAIAGVWAGLRENKRVKDERSQHAREMATGGALAESIGEDDKRRLEMEDTRYQSVAATSLTEELRAKTSEDILAAGEGQSEAVKAALAALAQAQARIELSDSKNIDLLHYTSQASVGEERMLLDLARIEARKMVDLALTPELRTQLGMNDTMTVKDMIAGHAQAYTNELEESMSAKDKAFNALKRRRVAKAAVTGTVVGIAGGLVAQEVIAGIDPGRYSFIESVSGATAPVDAQGDVHQTILASFVNGEQTTHHIDASTTYDQFDTGASSESFVKTGDDMEWNQNSDGTFTLVGPDGKSAVENITVNTDGSIDQPTIERIQTAGFNIEDTSWPEEVKTTQTSEISLDQYWQNNTAQMQKTSIDTWYDNNSPRPDLNELRMYRGGDNGIIDGGYRFESGMTADGSFVNGQSANPAEAVQQGNLVWVVSRMGEDGGPMMTIPAGPDGSLTVMQDDPAGALFANVNGRAELAEGYRLHAFYSDGVDQNGVLHGGSLATMVGEAQVNTTTQTEIITSQVIHHQYEITSEGYDVVNNTITEVAPITPIQGRRPLEVLAKKQVEGNSNPNYLYYGTELMGDNAERVRQESSPRLQSNPDAELNPKEELDWFHDDLVERRGLEYVADLDVFVENNPALRSMSPEASSIVTIPVSAVSEAENIYSTLSLFAQQDRGDSPNPTILMNVNWLDSAMDDPDKVAAIQKTISEIERARADFPNLSIAVMQKEYNETEVSSTGGVIGYVASDLLNTALLAVQSKMKRGEMAPDHDVLIVRSDADVDGMSRGQLSNLERAANENKNLDIVKGVTRFGTADYEKFPGFGISMAFINMMSIVSSQENAMHTGGANFGVRASTFAAIGGLGKMYENGKWYTGAGSDDTFVGQRIRAARQMGDGLSRENYYQNGTDFTASSPSNVSAIRRVKVVAGAAVDSNPQRLLPFYVAGKPVMGAWVRSPGGFSDGPGGHRDRLTDYQSVKDAPKERVDTDTLYKSIELNIGAELKYSSERVAKKSLGMFFAGVAGGYTIEGEFENPDNPVKFSLTPAGRAFIKKRILQETNTRSGSYGLRKMRQLYGKTKPGAKRQPAGARSPLVSPLT